MGIQSRNWSIRQRLMLLALAVVLPFVVMTSGVVWQLAENERENQREAILYSTRTLMSAVDSMLSKQIAVAKMLAASPALQADDIAEFRKEAERAAGGLSGGWVLVADEHGQQLVNLVRPANDPLPIRNPENLALQRRALETGEAQISNVGLGRFVQRPVVTIEVPVIRPGKRPLGLALVMDSTPFKALLDERHLPEGWLAGLIDRDGHFIARSRDHDRTVGRPASEGFRGAARKAREGWSDIKVLEGETVINRHVTSELTGWVLGLAADKRAIEAPIYRTILSAAMAGGIATLLSLLLATWAARKIAGPIAQIEQGIHALLRREPIVFSKTGVPEVDRALDAFVATAGTLKKHERDRDEREAHVHLIMRELSHRSKNLLAIVMAIARQTARNTSNFEDFEKRFNSRIQALADAHDLLVEQQWAGAALDELVRAQLSAFGTERVSVSGDKVILRAEAVQNVALALHELATNAVKYGALSVPEGRVAIQWTPHGDDPDNRGLRLTWRETGGPPVTEPGGTGFGRFVLERVTVNALGSGGTEFNAKGLIWTCHINAEHLVPAPGDAATRDQKQRIAS